ncbi:MAG: Ribosome-binding factor [Pseudomonadota bacterium]|jgi:ribosome-binding factor A
MKTVDISNRQLRVAELIKLALIDVLRKGKVKHQMLFDSNITITDVRVSADLKIANCYVMPFNSNISKKALMEALEAEKFNLRGLVTSKIQLKFSPELRFFYDHGLENASEVNDILKTIN